MTAGCNKLISDCKVNIGTGLKIVKIQEIVNQSEDKNILSISWDVSSVCNYKCNYCSPRFNDGKSKFPELNQIKGFFQSIKSQFKGRRIGIEIKGGEPTLWPDLPKFLQFCEENRWQSILISNGTASEKWWAENVRYMNYVLMSFHPERSSIQHFSSIASAIQDRCFLHVAVMMSPLHYDQAMKAWIYFSDNFPHINVSACLINEKVDEYTSEQMQEIAKCHLRKQIKSEDDPNIPEWKKDIVNFRDIAHAVSEDRQTVLLDEFTIKSKKLNYFKGWDCKAGMDRLHIAADGSIYRGTCEVGGSLGKINGEWVIPNKPINCDLEMCSCTAEIFLEKRKKSYIENKMSQVKNFLVESMS